MNSPAVFHATFSFTTANENVYHDPCGFPTYKGRFRYWCIRVRQQFDLDAILAPPSVTVLPGMST
jgi:hypothetical protein